MASRIAGIGDGMFNAFSNTLDLSNKYTDYQNKNMIEQYQYPAMVAAAKAARSGSEVVDLHNLATAIDLTQTAGEPAEADRIKAARQAGQTLEGAEMATGQAPIPTVLQSIQSQAPYTSTQGTPAMDVQSMYASLLQNGMEPAQALQQSISQYFPDQYPNYLR